MIANLTEIRPVAKYLSRINAEPKSLYSARVTKRVGRYHRDIALIRFNKSGIVKCLKEYKPTKTEQQDISREFEQQEFPAARSLPTLSSLPPGVENDRDLYVFRNLSGEVVMLQQRIEVKGEKAYIPWTFWSDGQWRRCESGEKMPLYNLPELKEYKTVFIHEGANAARKISRVLRDESKLLKHPWGEYLAGAAHIGWASGALNPRRTDWAPLRNTGIHRAYIVSDNDWPGKGAIPVISKELRCITFSVEFTDVFPIGFDLGDEFPDDMFTGIGKRRFYTGPTFAECLHPATWATDKIPQDRGRPKHVLRDSFKRMWVYVEEADQLVCRSMPNIIREEKILNKMVAPYSHIKNTSGLIISSQRGRSVRMAYRPDIPKLMITNEGTSAINVHVPSVIRARNGLSDKPWIEFLNYLVPNEEERHEIARWCATLIARPDVRIGYGLLLITERQGIGKTTLGAHILAPLVGWHNASVPGEADIMSQFNSWIAHKRLAVINEIYTGSSWKSYHLLKAAITDRHITVNKKYVPQYQIENWCHIFACSNSRKALKVEDSDRRWFYPELNEKIWPKKKFIEFRFWLDSVGLGIIRNWAEKFGDYISMAEHAPMTLSKKELIEASQSMAKQESARLAEIVKDIDKPVALAIRDIRRWLRDVTGEKVFDSNLQLRRAMINVGLKEHKGRIKLEGVMQNILLNFSGYMLIRKEKSKAAQNRAIKKIRKQPEEVAPGEI